VVTLRAAADRERRAVDLLLGTRSRGQLLRVDLRVLERVLVETTGENLSGLVTQAVGPVRDRATERQAVAANEAQMWEGLESHPALARHPALREWIAGIGASGGWRRLDAPSQRLAAALHVLAALPPPAPCGRSRLAAELLGDALGLDDAAVVGRLVLSAIAAVVGSAGGGGRRPYSALSASERRRLWASAGLLSDETSSTVLVLGLRPRPVGPLTEAVHRWADGGVPLPVPLAAFAAERWRFPRGTLVHCCENPSVVEGARELGSDCLPVVCVEGRPSLAALALLDSLADCGAEIRYHGDFGSGGISIANAVIRRTNAVPWRFCASDQAEALARAKSAGLALRPLRGAVEEAVWDPHLAGAVRAAGVEVEEELSLDLLVADLRSHINP
jgi:uncharacterized protein (TIGR02679 family)